MLPMRIAISDDILKEELMMKKVLALTVVLVLAVALSAFAANKELTPETQNAIQQAMQAHIEENTVDGNYLLYDAVTDQLKKLVFKETHTGIWKKGDFYISCSDFTDSAGTLYDLDLLVVEKEGGFRVIQSVVHAIGDEKRKYHLEE